MAVWAGFITLGVIWGSSFLLIKIGVAEFTPVQLIFVRVGTAALALALTLFLTGRRFPKDTRSRLGLMFVGTVNIALPFFLITWGEQTIDSGLATVLNATVPLFSLVIGHFALTDERITLMKVIGLVSGFGGVVILASRSLGQGEAANSLAGQGAVLLASLCYATATVYVRRNLRHLPPMVVSTGATVWAALLITGVTLFTDGLPNFAAITPGTNAAVVALGLVNTYIAFLLFYWIIDQWGATRATLVTYLMPPVGLTLGVLLLGEPLDVRLVLGAALIIAGVAVVNLRRRAAAPAPPQDAARDAARDAVAGG